jgi:hypothetical protein
MHRGKLMHGDKKNILVHFMSTNRYENFLAHILDEKMIPLPGAHAL